ncbi:MAG: TonB-dependent receptor [Chitinophagaceae bacterium]
MRIFISIILLLSTINALAQNGSLKGFVKENTSSKKPLYYATIVLKSKTENAKTIGAHSNENGKFEIKNINPGNYHLIISSLGYQAYESDVVIENQEKNIGDVLLDKLTSTLEGVTVKGEKNTIEIHPDKKVFNVDKNITSAGGSAEDLLRNVPSVNVDADGGVSIRGKESIMIFIDGKPSAMFGDDPQEALKAIPAASIESIEVITNPSSKYESQGANGILNIILKKDRKKGYNGSINLGATYPLKLNAGINLNANIKKWNIFLNSNYRKNCTWEKGENYRTNFANDYTYNSTSFKDRNHTSVFANFGVEYNFNSKNSITFTESIFNASGKGVETVQIENRNEKDSLLNGMKRVNDYNGQPLGLTSNIKFAHTGKNPKETLNIETNLSRRFYKRRSDFTTSIFDGNRNETSYFDQHNPIDGGNYNITFQIDYVKPLSEKAKIEFGEKTNYFNFQSENQPTIQYANQAEVPETILKNKFNFTQQVHGVYATYSNQFKKTSLQVGLRGEYFAYEGFIYQYNVGAKNSYFNLFPTLFINHKLTNKEDITLSYTRRYDRPNFFQLIPYINVSNPQDTNVGNPNLKPEFIHALEASYSNQYMNNNLFLVSAYYQYTNGLIQRYRRFNTDGTTFTQTQNLSYGTTYGVEVMNKIFILPTWDATINLNIFRNKINGNNIDKSISNTGYGGFLKLITNYKLPHDFNVQLSGNFFAKTVTSQGEILPYWYTDLAIKKSLYKNLVNLTLNVNDVFNTLGTTTIYNRNELYYQELYRKNLTQTVGLNLQVMFGNRKDKNNKNPKSTTSPKSSRTKKQEKKEMKNRDENLKKDEGEGNDG